MSANQFICGVIEGFYGRPWTGPQRRRMFGWLQQWGMNTYMYAPMDDIKHRALWRELYDESEAAELKRAAGDTKDPVITISADALASHQSVIRVMEAAQVAGYGKIAFTIQTVKK